jgi:hypothetical protein
MVFPPPSYNGLIRQEASVMRKCIVVPVVMIFCLKPGFSQDASWRYLGQAQPGDTPELFAPGVVSVDQKNSHALAVSPDGKTIIFSRYPDRTSYIMTCENGRWSGPAESFFFGKEISFSRDGNQIYYYTDGDIFYVEKRQEGWSVPIRLGAAVNTGETEYYPCIVSDGSMYFSRDGNWNSGRLMVSRFRNGEFQTATDLGLPVNSGGALHAWVAPDESAMLFNSPRSGSRTRLDIWASFRKMDGTWTNPQNLGETVNSGAEAVLCPTVSPDGKFLFFTKMNFSNNTGNMYWVSTGLIDSLRQNATGLKRQREFKPGNFNLFQNYPNPFSSGGASAPGGYQATLIRYSIKSRSPVKLTVYNCIGQKIATLCNSFHEAGSFSRQEGAPAFQRDPPFSPFSPR